MTEPETIMLDETLRYEEMAMEILDSKIRKTRKGETKLVKVLWTNHEIEEATWEAEETMRASYAHLFD